MTANYQLNVNQSFECSEARQEDLMTLQGNGTVRVLNTAKVGPRSIDIVGTATPVDSAYGAGGAFVVSFPGTPDAECPGPNYIVQGTTSHYATCKGQGLTLRSDYAIDWAIVQTQNWSTLYILSRERQPAPASVDVSLTGRKSRESCTNHARRLGLSVLLLLAPMHQRYQSSIRLDVRTNNLRARGLRHLCMT